MNHSFIRPKSFFVLTIALFLILSSFSFAQEKDTKYVLRIRPAGDAKIILTFNIAYAEGDSITYPKLKFEQYDTEYVRNIESENFEALIQCEDEEQSLEVTLDSIEGVKVTGGVVGTSRIIHVWKNEGSIGISGF
ncbi:MAG: hypothetical protein JXA68_03460 [Ignavibacteriales bacterium]|nr:hypothetical protein [Ignavibacteriales bacterium]